MIDDWGIEGSGDWGLAIERLAIGSSTPECPDRPISQSSINQPPNRPIANLK
jgi:hypothetical protein